MYVYHLGELRIPKQSLKFPRGPGLRMTIGIRLTSQLLVFTNAPLLVAYVKPRRDEEVAVFLQGAVREGLMCRWSLLSIMIPKP